MTNKNTAITTNNSYAQALFELANDNGSLIDIEDQVLVLVKLISQVSEFKELNPTAENIAIIIYNRINNKINSNLKLKIRLYETQRNIVEYPA